MIPANVSFPALAGLAALAACAIRILTASLLTIGGPEDK